MQFDDWLNELEGYSSRLERAYDELVLERYNDNHSFWKTVLSWLKSSYQMGYEQGLKDSVKKKTNVINY